MTLDNNINTKPIANANYRNSTRLLLVLLLLLININQLTFSFKISSLNRNRQQNIYCKSQIYLKSDEIISRLYPALNEILTCPESLKPLKKSIKPVGCLDRMVPYLVNDEFQTQYEIKRTYFDLTIKESEKSFWKLTSRERIGQSFFQNPFISGIYERGYRQGFQTAGFPGIEKEFEEVKELFNAANASTVMDLSCGSGFMTRNWIKYGSGGLTIAADLSPNMLAETRRRCLEENLPLPVFVRCDSARLPFANKCFDAVHAGAAMHCWPNIEQSLSEIYRVLKPGGVFYASTFFANEMRQLATNKSFRNQGFYFFENEKEIENFMKNAGFLMEGGAAVVRREMPRCAIIKAVKATISDELFKIMPSLKSNVLTSV